MEKKYTESQELQYVLVLLEKILGIEKFYKDYIEDGIYETIDADTVLKLLETDWVSEY